MLLASAAAGGTIAAVRHLGENGIDVRVLSSQHLSAAAWSRRGSRSYLAPPENETFRFLDRLLEIGKADPGQVLLPTSDETAWLYTVRAALLERHFCIYQPSIESIQQILDKRLFAVAATKAGISVLPSWNPKSLDELALLAPTLPYPILIKPRTHVHRLRNDKGVVVASPSELIKQYELFVIRERDRAGEAALLPDAALPILQQFVNVGSEGVQSITGFIDRTGELFVTRRSTKVFQRSQPVGIGVCHESLPAAPALSQAVYRLCRELGYFGIFEVEFLRFDGQWAAIDFNPRFFNQMGMDIRRGMPLPLFAYLDASGDKAALGAAVATAQAEDDTAGTVFCDRFTLIAILVAQTLTSRISREDRAYWCAWMRRQGANAVDVAADSSDPMPGIVHVLSETLLGFKALPRFLRSTPPKSLATSRMITKAGS